MRGECLWGGVLNATSGLARSRQPLETSGVLGEMCAEGHQTPVVIQSASSPIYRQQP